MPKTTYNRQLWLFLLPYLAGTFILVMIPALATAVTAFTHYNALQPPTWAGLDNFRRLAENDLVQVSLFNSLFFVATAVPLRLLGALLLALLLQLPRRGSGLYRASVYLPTIMPEAAYALIWLWILNPVYGPLNLILQGLGLPAPAWLSEPNAARWGIVLLSLFTIGEGFIILLVGLHNIPRAVYESARVDGANGWQSFWRITLPLITPWLLLLLFRDLLLSLQNTFTPSFIITYGGPYYATTFVPLLVYELAFDFFEFGLAAALLLLTYVVTAVFILAIINVVGLREEDGG